MKTLLAASTASALLVVSSISMAEPLRVDAEVDPTAYVLQGYSLHLGVGYHHVRVDFGAFALAIPQFVHGDDGFDVSSHGFGAKVQYFFSDEPRGFFAGVGGDLTRALIERQGTDLAVTQTQGNLGVNAGYRIEIAAGFYATPWLGVGAALGAHDVTLAGATYKASPVNVFPAVHLGYRFH